MSSEEFSRRTSPFGTRVPHGPLIHDMYLGLLDRLGRTIHECGPQHRTRPLTLPSPPSGARVQNRLPLPPEGEGWGEGAMRVHELSGLGLVSGTALAFLFNQRGEPVQEGEHVLLLARRAR